MARVLVVGDIMTDVIVKPTGPLVRGSDRAATIRTLPGGSAANQAAWLAHFGVSVTFAAKIGRPDVVRYEPLMRRFGVEPAFAIDDSEPSGMLVSIVDPDGERSFLTDRGANDTLDREDLPDSLLDDVRLVQLSGYSFAAERPRAAVLDLIARARSRGIAVSVDPASGTVIEHIGAANFLAWTKDAAMCFPNDAEAIALTGATDPQCQRTMLSEFYECSIIKRGDRGAELSDADGKLLHAERAAPARCVDSTGAGDAFLAAFVAAALHGAPLRECLDNAVEAGSKAVTTIGGQPSSNKMTDAV